MMATRLEGWQALRPLWGPMNQVLMPLDVGAQNLSGSTIRVADIGNECVPDSIWCLEKHAMETQMIPVEFMAFQGDHDGSIMRPDNSDLCGQLCTQPRLSEALIGSRRVKRARHTSLLRGEYNFSPKYGCSTLRLQAVHTVAKTPGGGKHDSIPVAACMLRCIVANMAGEKLTAKSFQLIASTRGVVGKIRRHFPHCFSRG